MFQNIRYRLLLSYLLIFASVLSIFALGVAASAEWENDKLKIENDFRIQELLNKNQSLQWFDAQGKLLYQQGKSLINLPFSKENFGQIQEGNLKFRQLLCQFLIAMIVN